MNPTAQPPSAPSATSQNTSMDPIVQRISVPRTIKQYRKPWFDTQPDYLFLPYASTERRAPLKPTIPIPQTLSEITGPRFGPESIGAGACDLTVGHGGSPIGERIVVSGRVLDENGRPQPNTLIEIWQANAAGRYLHKVDQHNAPIDPNFPGSGHALTDEHGHFRFVTVRPGEYPWGNHYNAWRPAHIHYSVFGPAFAQRLITQMYFPGDPLLPFDPIFNSVRDEKARNRLISKFDWDTTIPREALGYRFDIVLRGADAMPWDDPNRL
jgi:protocatechuate 3,4-dioxygenase, beta subunit